MAATDSGTYHLTERSMQLVDRLASLGLHDEARQVGRLAESALAYADAALACRRYASGLEDRQATLVNEVLQLKAQLPLP